VVIASPGGEETLNRAHALHGSEFLLKDPEGHYALLLPTLIRKLLRQEDRDETTRDIIRSSEERYRSLIEALPDIVYKIDPNGYFTFVNASVRKLGYEPEELIGQHFSIIVDEEDLTRVSRRKVLRDFEGYETGAGSAPGLFDERRTGERRTTGLEIRLKRRGLSQSDNRDRIIASLISYGEITATGHYRTEKARRYFTGTVGIIRDVTERKQSQKRLRQLSFAVEQISTALCITDGDGVVDYANPSFFRLNDVRPEDVFGIRASEVFAGYLQEDEEGELARVLRGTRFWEADRIVWTRSGDSVWCWFRVYPLFDVEQQVSQYVLFQEDITDRKQRELVLARSAESHQDVLRMIHHRVSANLAALRTQDADADELSRRMRAQILVHEIMHQSGSFDRLDMVRYLEELPPAVLAERSARGRLDVQLEELVLGINAGLPLALATAECLATLWPPPDAHTRTFTAVLEEEDPAALVVRFEGEDPFDGGPNSVIETLIAQVDGTFSHEPGEIRLSFRFDAPEIPSQEAPS
jgi:PAS domain S-box-containing protein